MFVRSRYPTPAIPTPLPDALWQRLEPLFEPQAKGAPPRYAKRSLVEAIFLVLREGRPWKSLPSSYPPGKMVYWHYQNWVSRGVWAEVEGMVGEWSRGWPGSLPTRSPVPGEEGLLLEPAL